ncbi:MAG: DUF4340 domain-containing protein [Phycisphaerales bacterium]|nr:DUF4340 domain-containing protein [Phycisphaerales bacterium]
MSRSGSLLAIALALFVGAGVWWALTSQRRAPEAPARLLDFSPASITGMTVRIDGREYAAARTPSGDWELLPPAGSTLAPWPLNAGNVRAALSVLADLRFDPTDDPGEDATAGAVATLTTDEGDAHTVAFIGQPVGGRALAVAQNGAGRRAGFVEAPARDMLVNPGPRGWRVMQAMPGVGVEVSRVRVTTPGGTLLLGQVGGSWTLREPVAARADATAVQNVLATLTSIPIERFIDDGSIDRAGAGLAAPTLRIVAETDARDVLPGGDVAVRTRTRTLDVGAAADLEARSLFASPDGGATIFTIPAGALRALPVDALACIARAASGVAPTDVGMAHVRFVGGVERGCRRGMDGWDELAPDGAMLPLEPEPVQDMLDFLSARLPAEVRLVDGDTDVGVPWATVTLFGFADEPLEMIDLVRVDGAPAALSRRVLRVYRGEWPALLTPEGVGAGGR